MFKAPHSGLKLCHEAAVSLPRTGFFPHGDTEAAAVTVVIGFLHAIVPGSFLAIVP